METLGIGVTGRSQVRSLPAEQEFNFFKKLISINVIYNISIMMNSITNADKNKHLTNQQKELSVYFGVLIMSFVIITVQLLGVYISNSLALFADSSHVAADILAGIVSLVVILTIKHKQEKERVVRTIGGWINSALLVIVALFILYEAYNRLVTPIEINSPVLVISALAGGIGNLIQYFFLKSARLDNITIKALEAHIKSDFLQSVVVVFGGVSILLIKNSIIDTILSVFIGLLLLKWAFSLSLQLIQGNITGSFCAHNHEH